MVFEEIRVCHALSDENAVGDVAEFGFGGGFVIETDCVAHLLPHCNSTLIADSVCHADGCHSSRLGDDDIDLFYWFLCTVSVLVYF